MSWLNRLFGVQRRSSDDSARESLQNRARSTGEATPASQSDLKASKTCAACGRPVDAGALECPYCRCGRFASTKRASNFSDFSRSPSSGTSATKAEPPPSQQSKARTARLLDSLADFERLQSATCRGLLESIESLSERNVENWCSRHEETFGPLGPGHTNREAVVDTAREAAAVAAADWGGASDRLKYGVTYEAAIVEIYRGEELKSRHVVLKRPDHKYLAYLAWLS